MLLFEETVEIKWFDKKNNFSEWFRGTSFIVADCFYDDYDKYSFFNYFSKIGIESDRFVLPFLNVAPDILGIQLRLKGIKPLIHFKIPQYELHCLMEKINAKHTVSKNYVFPTLNHRLIVVHIDDILQIIVTHQQDGGYGEECFENKLWMNKDYQILYRGEKIMIDEYMEDEAFGSPLLMDTFIFHNIQWKFYGDDEFENEFWEEYSKNLLKVEKYDGPTSFTYEYLMLNNATYFCTDMRFLRAEQYKIIPYHYNKWLETEKSTQFLNLNNEKVDESGKPIKLDNNENQNDEPNISDEEG
jgi:hypothetical protein